MSNLPPAGWYPDETQLNTVRYWDGTQWTEQRAPQVNSTPAPAPLPERSLGAAYAWLVFLGATGAHRRYLVHNRSANTMLIVLIASVVLSFFVYAGNTALVLIGGLGRLGFFALGIWCTVDLFLLPRMAAETNRTLAEIRRRSQHGAASATSS